MKKLKDLYAVFVKLTKSNIFIWSYPTLALAVLALFPLRVLAFILLGVWTLALINNTDEER